MKTFILAAITVFAVPALSLAATYNYVDMTGEVESVEAANASQAMIIASDIAPNSGVAIDKGILDEGDNVIGAGTGTGADTLYQYVDVTGEVEFVQAASAAEALQIPADIAPTSGVINTEADMVTVDEVIVN